MKLEEVQPPSCEVVLSHPDGTRSSFSLTLEEAKDMACLYSKTAFSSTSKTLSAIKAKLEQDEEAVRRATWTFDGSMTLSENGASLATFNLFDGREASALLRYIADRGGHIFLENKPQGQAIAHILPISPTP